MQASPSTRARVGSARRSGSSSSGSKPFVRLVVAASMLAVSLDVAAVSATIARTGADVSGSQVPVNQQGSDVDTGTTTSSSAFSASGAGGTADAFAQLGVIKVDAAAFSPAGGVVGHASAEGGYTEDITISSVGLNGTAAKVTVGVSLQGFIDPQGSMGGTINWSFNGAGFLGSWSTLSSPAFPGGFPVDGVSAVAGGPLFYSNVHNLTISFILGSPFTVNERLTASAYKIDCGFNDALCETTAAGSVNIDFGHSSYWNGVSAISVLDASGHYVPADLSLFTATSTQGVDMMQSFVPASVPEPAGAAMLLAGLAGLLGWRARQRTG